MNPDSLPGRGRNVRLSPGEPRKAWDKPHSINAGRNRILKFRRIIIKKGRRLRRFPVND
jgi:hypothetical protein